jgi:hypothetical protein
VLEIKRLNGVEEEKQKLSTRLKAYAETEVMRRNLKENEC